jgi:hypothetical protein
VHILDVWLGRRPRLGWREEEQCRRETRLHGLDRLVPRLRDISLTLRTPALWGITEG